ncbi:Abi family protein [Riemerella anatipestifer]|nr:Abi family protein [Riemerella anatipestifer]
MKNLIIMGSIATSIDEQIDKLEKRGMIFDIDKDKVKEILLDIGYYRLGFYWHPFETNTKTHKLRENIKFSTILNLYYLDVDLRHLLIKYINRIEINFRTKLVYYCSNKYKSTPTWFIHPKVISKDFIEKFDYFYNDDFIAKNKVIAKHHKNNLNDKYAPAWKTLEYFTFGTNLKIYKSLLNNDIKERISKLYKVNNFDKFTKLIDTIVFVRNYCAHGGVMFDLRYAYGIPKLPFYEFNDSDRHCLDSCIKIIIFILEQISENRSKQLSEELDKLFDEYRNKDTDVYDIIQNKIKYRI